MRRSSCANSPASSPPAPARTSRITLRSSLGSRGSRSTLRRSFSNPSFACSAGSSSFASDRISGSLSSTSPLYSATSARTFFASRNVSTSSSSCARSFATCEKRVRSPITSGLPRSAVSRSNLCSISCSLSSTCSCRSGARTLPAGGRERNVVERAAPMALPTSVVSADPTSHTVDLLALLIREGEPLGAVDRALDGLLARCAKEEDFTGKDGQVLSLHTHGKLGALRIAAIGLGKEKDPDRTLERLRVAASRAVKLARPSGAKSLAIAGAFDGAAQIQALAEGASLGAYAFDRYKKEKKPLKLTRVELLVRGQPGRESADAARLGCEIADAVCAARDLVNESPGRATPRALAAAARKTAGEAGLKCEVLGRAQIEKLGMTLFLGVAQGSAEEPQLVRISYDPARAKGAPVALVGKAITFDSGGLSLKTAQGMEDMKTDMAGAAAVISAMRLVAALRPPFPVRGYFGACENLPSGTAYKPGDVIVGKNGTSVEVLNTDAEGRLVLADVLAWAVEEKPAAIVDLATLTGAILVALGPWTAGLFSNDDALANELLESARTAGEPVWRMPLPPEMEELIKSPVADLKNTGGRYGGSINAALFLQHFVGKLPWAHLDIAGPASIDKERGYNPRGGTGAGVRLLAQWIRRRAGGAMEPEAPEPAAAPARRAARPSRRGGRR